MSNHTNDPWETEMSRTFDQRVRDLHEAPLSFDQVRGKATRIRRTRRLAAAGGALAAAAVIVPIAVFAGGALTEDTGPDPAVPNPTVVDAGDPGFAYLEGRTLHLTDGTTVQLDARYDGGAVLGDTAYLTRNDDDTGLDRLDVVDAGGQRTQADDLISGPVADDAHTVVAYLQQDGTLTVEGDGFGFGFSTDLREGAQITAVTGGPDCEADCRIYVEGEWGTSPLVFDADGNPQPVVPDAVAISDASEAGLVTVQTESSDTGSCSGVYDTEAGRYLWETCDHFLFALSPDSTYVDATHPYLDGFGNAYAAILDVQTQAEVALLDPPDGTAVVATRWQDDTHLLATVHGPEGWSVFRLSATDGDVEQVVGPSSAGNELNPAYVVLGGR